MKKTLITFALSTLSLGAFANIPQVLQDFLPAGKNSITLAGVTKDQKKCKVAIEIDQWIFGATLFVENENGGIDSRRLGKFQVGLGHDLVSAAKKGDIMTAISEFSADDQYSRDSRATLSVRKMDDTFKSVQIVVQEYSWLGLSTKVNEICQMK